MRRAAGGGVVARAAATAARRVLGASAIVVGALAGGAILASGCSGDPALDELATRLATTYCTALATCCAEAAYAYDERSCQAQMTAEAQRFADIAKRGKVLYDAKAVQGCVDSYRARAARCSSDAGNPSALPDAAEPYSEACAKIFRGTVAPGDPCTEAAECQANAPRETATCVFDTRPGFDRRRKICTKQLRRAPGEECKLLPSLRDLTLELPVCDERGFCELTLSGTVCRAYVASGEACIVAGASAVRCDPQRSLYCDGSTRRCAELPRPGQSCAQPGACVRGAFCDGATRVCGEVREDGAACDQPSQCASGSCVTMTAADGGRAPSRCADDEGPRPFEVTPRSCGFGPLARGLVDAGASPVLTTSLFGPGAPRAPLAPQ